MKLNPWTFCAHSMGTLLFLSIVKVYLPVGLIIIDYKS